MISTAISFIAGIAAFHFSPFFPCSITIISTALVLYLFVRHKGRRRKVIVLIVLFLIGAYYSFLRDEKIPDPKLPDRDVHISAVVSDVPELSGDALRFTAEEVLIAGKRVRGKVRLAAYQKQFAHDLSNYDLFPGARISAVVKLRAGAVQRNHGVYSYDPKKHGIIAQGVIRQLQITGDDNSLFSKVHRKRQRLGKIIERSLSHESAALLKAIIPGLKKGISQDMRDAFSSTGLAHLLSISGTHFGLLAFVIFVFIRNSFLLLPERYFKRVTLYITPTQTAALLTVPALILYALISGLSIPTVRSLIMVFIYLLALCTGRKGQWLNSLATAAVIILILDPKALFDLSFLLSFIAVLSIGYMLDHIPARPEALPVKPQQISEKIMNLIAKARQTLKTAPLLTIAAVAGTAPVVALVFKQISLISPVTNLVVTPIVCFIVLPLGFFTGFSALVFDLASLPLSGLTDSFALFALKLVALFSRTPFTSIHVQNPSVVMTVLYYLSLLLIISFGVFAGTSEKKVLLPLRWRVLPFILVISFYIATPYFQRNTFSVTFLDTGQGDASVVEIPGGTVILVDGGTKKPDMGRRVVAPYLWSRGIRTVDYIVVSHPHPDHYGGLMYLLENFNVGEIWLNKGIEAQAIDFLEIIERRQLYHNVLKRGDALAKDQFNIHVFHPYDEFAPASSSGHHTDQNNSSLVFKIASGGASVLFTGDIEEEAEHDLLHLGAWLKSDIMKVPHHGSRTSSSREIINVVQPRIAVATVGRDNPFHHPHEETVSRYENADVRFIRTDRSGSVTIRYQEGTYHIADYDEGMLKKVSCLKDEIRNLKLLL